MSYAIELDFIFKKPIKIYYTYTTPKTIKLWFNMEKSMKLYQKLLNFDYYGNKSMALIKPKTFEL